MVNMPTVDAVALKSGGSTGTPLAVRPTIEKKDPLGTPERIAEKATPPIFAIFKDKLMAISPKLMDEKDFSRIGEWLKKPENAKTLELFVFKVLEPLEPGVATMNGSVINFNSDQLNNEFLIRPFLEMAMQQPEEFKALVGRINKYEPGADVVSFMDTIHNQILAYVDEIRGLPTREKYGILADIIYDPRLLVGYAKEAHVKNYQIGGDGVDMIRDLFLGHAKREEIRYWKLEKPEKHEEPEIA